MSDGLRVCHVLNSLSGMTIPVDIGVAQLNYTDVTDLRLCAWFTAEPVTEKDNLTIQSLEAPRSTPAGFEESVFDELRQTIREYDVVHTHDNHAGLYGKVAAKLEGIPLVSTEHNDHTGFTRKGRIANGVTNPLCDAITCVSDAVFESFTHWEQVLLDKNSVTTVHNGIDLGRLASSEKSEWTLDEHAEIRDDSVVVGNAATLSEQKNQETLIRAIAIANEQSTESIELVMSGDGRRREFLERVIAKEGVGDQVHLLGYLEDRAYVYQMIRASEVFAMPSRWEGSCVAVLEAIALQTPAVLSDIDVFREVYGDVARYHAVEDAGQLAEQLMYFAERPEERKKYAKKGRELASSYRLERTAREYVSVYDEIL